MSNLADLAASLEGDCNAAFDALLEGMRRQTKNIWRGVGITIKMQEMPSWPERERAYNAAYGNSLVSDVRCKLRSWLFPNRHEALVQAYQKTRYRVQAEMLNSVIRQGGVDERQAET